MTESTSFEPRLAAPELPSTQDIMAEYAAGHARFAELRLATKEVVFDRLAKAGLTLVIVTFDGCGDSGQIEDITARSGDAEATLPAEEVEVASDRWGQAALESRLISMRAAIEDLAYSYLEQAAAGWENNDGAYGEFTFDVAARTITLDYNERYTSSEFTQFDF